MTTQYFVDSIDGDDAAAGTSERAAWRTLDRVYDANMADWIAPGDSVLLRRGCTWTDAYLRLTGNGTAEQPLTLGEYGAGPRPVIQIDAGAIQGNHIVLDIPAGSYIVLRGLRVTLSNPYRNPAYGNGKFGWLVGAAISGHHITLDDCEFSNLALGVSLTDDSHDCQITNCHFHDLDAFWNIGGAPGIMGAVGVLLHGADHVVAGNRFERNRAGYIKADGTEVTYSAPVEFFNANRCTFTRNVALGHRKTAEFGVRAGFASADNVFSHNLIVSDVPGAVGPNVHKVGDYGPVTNTTLDHNTIILTGVGSQAVVAGQPQTIVRNNIFQGVAKSYLNAPLEDHNIFFGPVQIVDVPLSNTSRRADPLLDAATYAPLSGSPCLGAATDGTAIGAVQPVVDETAEYQRLLAERNQLSEQVDTLYARAISAETERDAALADVARLTAQLADVRERAAALVTAATL